MLGEVAGSGTAGPGSFASPEGRLPGSCALSSPAHLTFGFSEGGVWMRWKVRRKEGGEGGREELRLGNARVNPPRALFGTPPSANSSACLPEQGELQPAGAQC